MKIPQNAPAWAKLFTEKQESGRINDIIKNCETLTRNIPYYHWDELRRRPVPDGFTLDEWWLAIKMERKMTDRILPLTDKTGRPFRFSKNDALDSLLHEIDRHGGDLIGISEKPSNGAMDKYLLKTLTDEAITSSQLEGAATTRAVAREMIARGRQPRDRSEKMILNNYRTMQHLREVCGEKLTPALVLDLHRRITEDALDDPTAAGRLRRADELVRVESEDGTVFHYPPDAKELEERLAALCRFANEETPDYPIHPVVRAILLHFQLAYDHPFVDGNGRTARALFYWAMLHHEYWLFEYLSISETILKARAQYGMAFLFTETDEGDATYFLLHQADVIRKSLDTLRRYVATKRKEMEEGGVVLHRLPGVNLRQKELLLHALKNPGAILTIAGHRAHYRIAYGTARTDLLRLAALELFEQRTQGREILFIVPNDLATRIEKASTGTGNSNDQ